MQELRFVAVSEDGQYAVLGVPGRSARFTLPIDERLRAVALGQSSRLAQYEIEVESPLRPKEIQARIRAGETVEEIADAAGIAVERVRWFEGPVLAERAYMADQAQKSSVRRQGDATPGPRLGEIVAERMKAFGAEPDDAQWDAKKRGDGSWLVQLIFITGGRLHAAEWIFDPRRRHVLPADDNAARMSLPGSSRRSLPRRRREATVTQLAPRLNTASGLAPPGRVTARWATGLATASANGGRPRYERPAAARPAFPSPRSPSGRLPNPGKRSLVKVSPGNPSPGKRSLGRLRHGNPRPESHSRGRASRASPSGASPRLRLPPHRRCRALRQTSPGAGKAAQVSRAAHAAPSGEFAPPARMAPPAGRPRPAGRHGRPAQEPRVAEGPAVAPGFPGAPADAAVARRDLRHGGSGGRRAPAGARSVPSASSAEPTPSAQQAQPEAAGRADGTPGPEGSARPAVLGAVLGRDHVRQLTPAGLAPSRT